MNAESTTLTEPTHDELRQQLIDTRDRLLRELAEGAQRRQAENAFPLHTGDVPDAGDTSVATEQADIRNAQIGRDVVELRQVEAALARLDDGTYGYCMDCGQDIPLARLRATPAAERCILCQTARERQYADNGLVALTRKV
jgi:DnaK suppressor protein